MNDSNTLLMPPWLNPVRALWICLTALAVACSIYGAWLFFQSPFPTCAPGEAPCQPWTVSQQDIELAKEMGLSIPLLELALLLNFALPRLFFAFIAVLIFWRKSQDWIALLLSLMLVGFLIEGVTQIGVLTPLLQLLYAFITGVFLILPFIFPNGRFVPRWTAWAGPVILVLALPPSAFPQLAGRNEQLLSFWILGSFLLWFVVGGYAAIYRYRRVSNPRERQQTKWVMAGILGTFVIFIPYTIITVWFPPAQPSPERLAFYFIGYLPIGLLSYLFVPVSIAVAIFRYHLWDIDIILRKTLTYALVGALLASVYFGSVVLLQQTFASMTEQRSELITVISTLAIAALFVPLRNRIQRGVDRRFYRTNYNAQQVLSQFAATVRDETDLENLTGRLMQVVEETMQPESVSVWLKKDPQRK